MKVKVSNKRFMIVCAAFTSLVSKQYASDKVASRSAGFFIKNAEVGMNFSERKRPRQFFVEHPSTGKVYSNVYRTHYGANRGLKRFLKQMENYNGV